MSRNLMSAVRNSYAYSSSSSRNNQGKLWVRNLMSAVRNSYASSSSSSRNNQGT
jgi:hypothetical protein